MSHELKDRAAAYLEPVLFVGHDWLFALVSFVVTMDFHALTHLSVIKDRAFAKFWLAWGPGFTANENESAVPALVASAYGVVVELGPGSGNQLPRMDTSKIEKVYGVEPVISLHAALRLSIKENKMSDIYQIVPASIEDEPALMKFGVNPGTVDTIISIQVLCSVPNPQETIRRLYELLKPGGQLIIFEHIENEDMVSRLMQKFWNLVWPIFLGNCHLGRPTERYLKSAGKWSKIELTNNQSELPASLLPRVWGRLIKANASK
ncbi:hypothetical protein MMC34_005808 [Xylographa carneopallida]|nr:hypothetical protein [Xylographa carneopallida]